MYGLSDVIAKPPNTIITDQPIAAIVRDRRLEIPWNYETTASGHGRCANPHAIECRKLVSLFKVPKNGESNDK